MVGKEPGQRQSGVRELDKIVGPDAPIHGTGFHPDLPQFGKKEQAGKNPDHGGRRHPTEAFEISDPARFEFWLSKRSIHKIKTVTVGPTLVVPVQSNNSEKPGHSTSSDLVEQSCRFAQISSFPFLATNSPPTPHDLEA